MRNKGLLANNASDSVNQPEYSELSYQSITAISAILERLPIMPQAGGNAQAQPVLLTEGLLSSADPPTPALHP